VNDKGQGLLSGADRTIRLLNTMPGMVLCDFITGFDVELLTVLREQMMICEESWPLNGKSSQSSPARRSGSELRTQRTPTIQPPRRIRGTTHIVDCFSLGLS
jgi:hypothetical protein